MTPLSSVCVRLQEVNAAPVRFISDMLQEDSWSHAFMDTLAPRGFVKVSQEQRFVSAGSDGAC